MPSGFTQAGVRKLLAFAGGLMTTASQAVTTSRFWAAVKAAAALTGADISGATIFDANKVRSDINAVIKAQNAVAAAQTTQTIDSSMIARMPGSVITAAGQLVPSWLVRYQAVFQTEEGLVTQWRSSRFYSTLPTTVGDLGASLTEAADEGVTTSSPPCGGQIAGIGTVQILAL